MLLMLPQVAHAAAPSSCQQQYQHQLDSGIHSEMYNGSVAIQECLKKKLIDKLVDLLPDKDRSEIEAKVNAIVSNYSSLYWQIHNENKYCPDYCGTMNHLFHHGAVNDLLERMIDDIDGENIER